MEYEIVGAIKIKDGLFLGDEYAAQDLEFVVTNKVTRIINCAGKQIPNHWNNIGVQYMTFAWLENDNQLQTVIFDPKDEIIQKTYKYIDEAVEIGDSVLVHSIRGHNRSVCIIAAYMMRKFRWTLYKTLEFLHSRRPDLEIRASFFNQLLALENRFTKLGIGAKTYNWNEIAESNKNELENEEIMLKNTFLNSKNQEVAEYNDTDIKKQETKIKWADQVPQETHKNVRPSSGYINSNNNLKPINKLNKLYIPPYPQCKFRHHKYNNKQEIFYKSIVKGKNGAQFVYNPPQVQGANNNSNKTMFRTHVINRNPQSAKPKLSTQSQREMKQQQLSQQQVTANEFNDDQNDLISSTLGTKSNYNNSKNLNNLNEDDITTDKGSSNNQIPHKMMKQTQLNKLKQTSSQQSDDIKLQASLNQIANRQLQETLKNNMLESQDIQNTQSQNKVQSAQSSKQNQNQSHKSQSQNQLQVKKIYGQKLGQKKNQQKKNQNNNNNNDQRRMQGIQRFLQNNSRDDEQDMNQQLYQSRSNGFENSFKSSQRIYTHNFGLKQPTLQNNFLGSQKQNNNNTQKLFEMPSLNEKQNKPAFGFKFEQEKKNLKKGNTYMHRPSTAPSKKQENNNNQYHRPQNAFQMRNGQNNHKNNQNNNNMHNDLFISGSQRQQSAQQQQNDNFSYVKKQRLNSPQNYSSNYNNNRSSNYGTKWKM